MDKVTFLNLFNDCINFLLENNFPLPIENINPEIRFINKKVFGLCSHKYVNGKMFHTISFNANFVKNGRPIAIKNTILHELLHTFPECQNHLKIWKSYANKVNSLTGLNICRVGGNKTEIDNNCLG